MPPRLLRPTLALCELWDIVNWRPLKPRELPRIAVLCMPPLAWKPPPPWEPPSPPPGLASAVALSAKAMAPAIAISAIGLIAFGLIDFYSAGGTALSWGTLGLNNRSGNAHQGSRFPTMAQRARLRRAFPARRMAPEPFPAPKPPGQPSMVVAKKRRR
jgi:hypothetical protein